MYIASDCERIHIPFDDFDLEIGNSNTVLSSFQYSEAKARLTLRETELWMLGALALREKCSPRKQQVVETSALVLAQINRYKIALAPWKLLPPELMQIIFNYTQRSPLVLFPPQGEQSPVLLCLVCKAWRELAMSTPELWSSVNVRLFSCHSMSVLKRQRQIESLFVVLRNWFTKAKGIPLNLKLTQGLGEWETQFIKSAIVPFLPRLQNLKLLVLENTFNELFRLPPGSMDSIVCLTVRADLTVPSRTDRDQRDSLNPFGSSPRLTELDVTLNSHSIIDPQFIAFPWENLKSLRIGNNMYLETFMEVAQRCKNLEEIDAIIVCRGGSCSFDTVNLPNLHTMSLSIVRVISFRPLDFPLYAPRLRVLNLSGNVEGLFNTKVAYQALLLRFGCKIESFAYGPIRSSPVLDGEIIIEATPSLKSLRLPRRYTLSPQFLSKMKDGEVGQSMERLYFNDIADISPILDFLEMQMSKVYPDPTSKIKYVELDSREVRYMQFSARIEALKRGGILIANPDIEQ